MEDRKRIIAANRLLMVEVLTMLLAGVLIRVYMEIGGTYTLVTTFIYSSLMVAFPVIIFMISKADALKQYFLFHRVKIASIPIVMVIMLLTFPAIQLINSISMFFTTNALSDSLNDSTVQAIGMPLMLLVVAVLPGIFEELVFRGVVYGAYRKKGIIKGAMLSALCFGLFHGNLNQFIYTFFLGLVFALLLEGTGNVLIPIIGHFTHNAISVLLLFLPERVAGTATVAAIDETVLLSRMMQTAVMGVITAITLPLAFVLFYLLCRINGRWEHIKRIFYKKRPSVITTNPSPKTVYPNHLEEQPRSYRLNGQVVYKSGHQEVEPANNEELYAPVYTNQVTTDQLYQRESQIQHQLPSQPEYQQGDKHTIAGPAFSAVNSYELSQKRKMNSLVSASLIVFIVICALEIIGLQFLLILQQYMDIYGYL